MDKSITYGELEDALLALGYHRKEIPESHRLFTNGDPTAMVMLPIVPRDTTAHQLHIMSVRSIVEDAGLLNRDDFLTFVKRGGAGGVTGIPATSKKPFARAIGRVLHHENPFLS